MKDDGSRIFPGFIKVKENGPSKEIDGRVFEMKQ